MKMGMPETEGYSPRRTLWVPQEIDAALSGKTGFLDLAEPRFSVLIQRYIAGLYVTGSVNGDPKKLRPDFERLLNVNEVWVMCFRSPRFNQWRLMGRFIAHEEFVGLGLYRRGFLDGEKKYHAVAEAFVARWQGATSASNFIVGTTIQHYISMPVSDPYVPII